MLVLTRRPRERMIVTIDLKSLQELAAKGEDLTFQVVVTGLDSTRVRLGFEAPRCVQVYRSELVE